MLIVNPSDFKCEMKMGLVLVMKGTSLHLDLSVQLTGRVTSIIHQLLNWTLCCTPWVFAGLSLRAMTHDTCLYGQVHVCLVGPW